MSTNSPCPVRPMRDEDIQGAVRVSAAAFGFELTDAHAREAWHRRVRHCLSTDPAGAFVAEQRGVIAGVALAIRRDGVWILSLLTVAPSAQGDGLGQALLASALGYAEPSDAGLIASSQDSRALTAYGLAGFALRPTFEARGPIDLGAMPADLPEVSDGSRDLEALGEISRAVRGASYALELPHALARGARIMRLADRGFAVAQRGHGVWLLAALDAEAATALLWHALAESGECERPVLRWITGEQQWAIEVALSARLRLGAYGALCVRGRPGPLTHFLPSASFA